MRARWYDPATAQFLTIDPLNAQTHQTYSYAADNPTNSTDPAGTVPSGCASHPECAEFGMSAPSCGSNGPGFLTVLLTIGALIPSPLEPLDDAALVTDLADETIIVRGGTGEVPQAGEIFSGSQGSTVEEAAAGVRHGTIRTATAGDIRAGGGSVVPKPEFDPFGEGGINYQHVDVTVGEGSSPFSEPFQNPVPKLGRFGFPGYPYDQWGP